MARRVLVAGIICGLAVLRAVSCHAAENDPPKEQAVLLEAHEPNRVGYTKDSDDKAFMDFLVSVQHPIAYERFKEGNGSWLPYFAFTGRFGQYIGTRDSAPVIAKRFNPKFFVRHLLDGTVATKDEVNSYIDFEYAHESNGQAVDSLPSFNAVANSPGNNPEFAKDYLSRGWDYLGLAGKHQHVAADWTLSYAFRKYLDRGWVFQKQIEQYMPWEASRSVTRINQVSGIHVRGEQEIGQYFLDDIALELETGNSQPFRYTTVTVELAITPLHDFFGIPFVLWGRTGYNSDIAQYYKKVSSAGVALRFESFKGGSRPVSVR